MKSLILHPQSTAGPIIAIGGNVEPTATGCRVVFVATGDLSQTMIPAFEADRRRCDNLWQTTCFELFWQGAGSSAYREFNLSPSSRWACYEFDDFRVGMRNAPAIVEIGVSTATDTLRLEAQIKSLLPRPALVALNAIVEGKDGLKRYWALAFADGAPDFHNSVCRAWPI